MDEDMNKIKNLDQMRVYIVIHEDRHVDLQVEIFKKPIQALKHVTEIQHEYGARYDWHEEEIDGWEYYTRTDFDNGPTIRIEEKLLR